MEYGTVSEAKERIAMRMVLRFLCVTFLATSATWPAVTQAQSKGKPPAAGEKTPAMMMDKPMMHPMMKDAMQMDKAREMANPSMVKKAGEAMMADEKMPVMMAHEMSMAATMSKPETMVMASESMAMSTAKGEAIVTEEEIKAAIRRVFSDPEQFKSLLQTMIARETATAMMDANEGKSLPVMVNEPAMMMSAKEAMMADKPMMAEKLAKEMMIHAMASDEKIMEAVKNQAMNATMPAVKNMMKDEKMMMAEKSMGTPAMQNKMAQDVMMRTMAKPTMGKSDKATNSKK